MTATNNIGSVVFLIDSGTSDRSNWNKDLLKYLRLSPIAIVLGDATHVYATQFVTLRLQTNVRTVIACFARLIELDNVFHVPGFLTSLLSSSDFGEQWFRVQIGRLPCSGLLDCLLMFQRRVDRGLYDVNGTPVCFTSVAVATHVNEAPSDPDGD